MKTLHLSLALLLTAVPLLANAGVVLTCSTAGDALDYVEFVQASNGSFIKIHGLDESVDTYKIRSSLNSIARGDSDTLIGQKSSSLQFGGSITDSVLVRITDGQKTAFLARGGVVYTLNCRK